MTPEHFAALKTDFLAALEDKEDLFIQDLFGGSQPEHRVRVRIVNELAWHNSFIRTMLVRPEEMSSRGFEAEYTIIDLPSFQRRSRAARLPQRDRDRGQLHREADPDRRHRLCRRDEEVACSACSTILLPVDGVMPMHCSANIGAERRYRGVLRPVGHRQDDAVRRRQPHADRRRRAWLVRIRRSSTSKAAATPR